MPCRATARPRPVEPEPVTPASAACLNPSPADRPATTKRTNLWRPGTGCSSAGAAWTPPLDAPPTGAGSPAATWLNYRPWPAVPRQQHMYRPKSLGGWRHARSRPPIGPGRCCRVWGTRHEKGESLASAGRWHTGASTSLSAGARHALWRRHAAGRKFACSARR